MICLGRDEVLGVFFLLRKRLRKGSQANDYTNSHDKHRNNGPNDAPALRRAAIALGKDARIRLIHLAQDQVVADIPHAVQRAHDADKQHHEAQRLGMDNEPAAHQQPDGEQHGQHGQPVTLPPPQRQQEAHAQDDGGDFAGDDVEAAHGEQGADEGRAEVARGEGDCADAAGEVGDAAFVGVEGDGLDAAAGEDGGDGVAEFVEGDDEHLWLVVVVLVHHGVLYMCI